MARAPRVLDLFCGAGGAAIGYARAGFEVIGVDIKPQPNYPFPYFQYDAIDLVQRTKSWVQGAFSAIHASPPCQSYSALTRGNREREFWWDRHPDLLAETRSLLKEIGLPSIMENVPGAQIRRDLLLCGEMFDLGVIRHRYFEIEGWELSGHFPHKPHQGRVRGWRHGVFYEGTRVAAYGQGGGKGSVKEWQVALGIDWTDSRKELREMIPPAYTELIGTQLLSWIGKNPRG